METIATSLYVFDLAILLFFEATTRQRGPISNFGIGPTAGVFRVYMIVGSLAAPILALQLWMAQVYPATLSIYLGLIALGRIGIAAFPLYPADMGRGRIRQLHRAFTLLAFVCAFMTVTEATPLITDQLMTGPHAAILWGLKHLITVAFLTVMLTGSPSLRRYFGLAERAFLYATGLWFITATLTLPPL